MYEMPMELQELSQDCIWQHVNINMGIGYNLLIAFFYTLNIWFCNIFPGSLTMMCWLVLPQMLQRRKGAIVNLSSSSSVGPLPYMNIYSASKVLSLKQLSSSCSIQLQSQPPVFKFVFLDLCRLFLSCIISWSSQFWSYCPNSDPILRGY